MRGPTLFSGYWREPEVNRRDFRGGWFHMGDVFVRNPDGTLDFVDRVKYLIKSGGENVYPAEIERAMMQDPRVEEVAVVRWPRRDLGRGADCVRRPRRRRRWPKTTSSALCRAQLAGYKQPRRILFIARDEFPRSASGKVQRHQLEARLRGEPAHPAHAGQHERDQEEERTP